MDTGRAHADRDLVLPYPDPGNRVAQNVFVVVFFGVVLSGPLIGLYAWSQTSGCWPMLVWFGGLGVGCALVFVRAIVNIVVTARRRARGDGWLHLSGTGFEIHPRTGKLRHYRWCEIDEFMRVESRDEDGGLVAQVGFRFAPQRHRTPRDEIRSALAPCDRDGTKSDGVLDGSWSRSVDDAVDLMNDWLVRSRVNL
jgi:hypothetical protein